MKPKKILLAGGGIAGLGAAHWLRRAGHEVVVIDKAKEFRHLGHVLSLKGTGVKCLADLDLVGELQKYALPVERMTLLDGKGRLLRQQEASDFNAAVGGLVIIRRSDLHRVLYEHLPEGVDLRFDLEVMGVAQDPNGADVSLSNGKTERFDVVLGSDGVHSKMRQLIFPEVTELYTGDYCAFMLDIEHNQGPQTISLMGTGCMVSLVPHGTHSLGGVVYQVSGKSPPAGGTGKQWREYLLRTYAHLPRHFVDSLATLKDDAFVFYDQITKIPIKSVAQGRIALVGDAGYCPTFFSGMGAAISLQGAYCLAAQLAKYDDVATALKAYERIITPIAAGYQDSATKLTGLVLNESPWKLWLRNLFYRYAPEGLVRRQEAKFYHAERSLADLAA